MRSVLIIFIFFPSTLSYSYPNPYVTPNDPYRYGYQAPNYGYANPYQSSYQAPIQTPYSGYGSYSYPYNPYQHAQSYWNSYSPQSYQNPYQAPQTYQHPQSYPSYTDAQYKSRKRNHGYGYKGQDYDTKDRYHDYRDRYQDRYQYDNKASYEYPKTNYKKSGYNYNIKHDRDAAPYRGSPHRENPYRDPYRNRDRYHDYDKNLDQYESEVIKVHDAPEREANDDNPNKDNYVSHVISDKLGAVVINTESDMDSDESEEDPIDYDKPKFLGRGAVELNNNKAIFSCFLFDPNYQMTSPVDWVKITGPYEYTSKGGVLPYVCSGFGSCTYEFIAVSAPPEDERKQKNTDRIGHLRGQLASNPSQMISNRFDPTTNVTYQNRYPPDYQIKFPVSSRFKTLTDQQLSFLIISNPIKSDEGYYRCSGVQTSLADGRNQTFFQIIKYFPDTE